MKINKLLLILAVCGVSGLSACHPNIGTPPIEKEEMISLLIDVHVAQALATRQVNTPPASKEALYKSVLDKHNVTMAQFDSAVAWYGRNAGIYKEVYQAVIDSLKNRRANVE